MTAYDAKTDQNQADIVAALRAAGCLVHCTHRLGGGFPDLVVYSPQVDRIFLFEVKAPGGKLNKAERKFFALWGDAWKHVRVVQSPEDALEKVGKESV